MALAGDSILVTPGSGATVATETVGGKEHQVVMLADDSGHIANTKPTYVVSSQNSANVAAARTTHFDLFNASGSGVRLQVLGIYIIPTLTAVTGVGMTWEIIRTSAVGTGGTTRTPVKYATANANLPAGVTARSKPTGGATSGDTLLYPNSSSEETIPIASLASVLNNVPPAGMFGQALELAEGEGIKVDQTTNSSVGSTNIVVVFTTE